MKKFHLSSNEGKHGMETCRRLPFHIPCHARIILLDYNGHADRDCSDFDNQMAARQIRYMPEKDLPSKCSANLQPTLLTRIKAEGRKRVGRGKGEQIYCDTMQLDFSGNDRIENADPLFTIEGLCQISNQIFANGLVEMFYLEDRSITELAAGIIESTGYISERRNSIGLFLNTVFYHGQPTHIPHKAVTSLLRYCGQNTIKFNDLKSMGISAVDHAQFTTEVEIFTQRISHESEESSSESSSSTSRFVKFWEYLRWAFIEVFKAQKDVKSKWILPISAYTSYEDIGHEVNFFLGRDASSAGGRLFLAYFDINFGFTVFRLKRSADFDEKSTPQLFAFFRYMFSYSYASQAKHAQDHMGTSFNFVSMNLKPIANNFESNLQKYIKFLENLIASSSQKSLSERMYESFGFIEKSRTPTGVNIDVGLLMTRSFRWLNALEPFKTQFSTMAGKVQQQIGVRSRTAQYVAQMYPFVESTYRDIVYFDKKTIESESTNLPQKDYAFFCFLVGVGLSDNFIMFRDSFQALFSSFYAAVKVERSFALDDRFCMEYEQVIQELLRDFHTAQRLNNFRRQEETQTINLEDYFNRFTCLSIMEHHRNDDDRSNHLLSSGASEKRIRTSVFGVLMMPLVVHYLATLENSVQQFSLYERASYAPIIR